ncbi:hypothetical protein LTS16_020458 [Friedmanniomyces endolithicus]|nr:hypothetical protein LTR38_015369 [Friedmanniomyces endolithicus]KAK0801229.1 hypothetical protein LTR75_008618 [Friedmanniomyces endolithicus]KAK0959523.1 hypothetical protein LTS01_021334 [Friedmanniomyces endolithicus]KAK1028580.1 hypothetical protein LTS16_020458 [Friedmanniomyces endolithicus]
MSCGNIWIKLRETETVHLHNQSGHRRTTNTITNLPLQDFLLGDFNTRAKQAPIASTTRSRRFRKYETFMSNDLDISSLQRIGDLEIEITMSAEKHLELVLGGFEHDDASQKYSDDLAESKVTGRPTLKIYWLDSYKFYENADVEQSRRISLEILRTWSFLLHPRHKSQFRSARRAYETLETPLCLKEYLEHLSPANKNLQPSELGDIIDANLHVHFTTWNNT